MIRPAGVRHFLTAAQAVIPATRRARLDRYTQRLFEDALIANADGTVFVLTGDIPAMWIRDSTWQVLPLLQMQPDAEIVGVLAGVSRMQSRLLAIDPYANAFNNGPTGECWHRDFADQSPWVFERKFEIDSLGAFLELALTLHDATGTISHLNAEFWRTASLVLEVIQREQAHDPESYIFVRADAPDADHLSHGGKGAPFQANGMVWSGFRPSDDRCELPFSVSANAHLSVVLKRLAMLATELGHDRIASTAREISVDIVEALLLIESTGSRWPYEVDGLGNAVFGDDPNYPNLLALPHLGWRDASDATYVATRDYVLSPAHARWRLSALAEGLASEHTPANNIWPLSIAMRGLTARNRVEQLACLAMLESTDGGTGYMHESFDVQDPTVFTRSWFSWADMTYAALVLRVYAEGARN